MKIRILIFLWILVIILSTSLLFHFTKTAKINFDKGINYYKKAEYKSALKYFRSAANQKPKNLTYLRFLLWTYQYLSMPEEADKISKKIYNLYPKDFNISRPLADNYYAKKEYSMAEEIYYFLVSEKPDPDIIIKLIEVQLWQKKYRPAVNNYTKYFHLIKDDSGIIEHLADAYYKLKIYDDAERLYERAVIKNPTNLTIKKLIEVQLWRKNYSGALTNFDKYADKISGVMGINVIEIIADSYYGMKKYNDAEKWYSHILQLKDNLDIRRKLAEVQLWQKKYKPSINNFLIYSKNFSKPDVKIAEYIADAYYSLNDYPNAEKYYRIVLQYGQPREIIKKISEVLLWQKKYGQAIDKMLLLLRKDPSNLEMLQNLGDAYNWSKNYAKSADIYKQLILKNYNLKENLLKLADILRYTGKDEQAEIYYKRYLNLK